MPTLEHVLEVHQKICDDARAIVTTKGADYNKYQQVSGNTLFNLMVCAMLGIVATATQGLLVRLSDKFMRLISLTKDPNAEIAVKDESVRDTVIDMINYVIYLFILYQEARSQNLKAETI